LTVNYVIDILNPAMKEAMCNLELRVKSEQTGCSAMDDMLIRPSRTMRNTTKDNKTQHSQEFFLGRAVYFQQLTRRALGTALSISLGELGLSRKNARGVAAHCSLTPINTTIRRPLFLGALHFIASGRNQTFQILQKSSIAPPTWRDKL
jgi:hypothetical protein